MLVAPLTKLATVQIAEIKAFMHYYNYERIQGCLNNLTPIEYKKLNF